MNDVIPAAITVHKVYSGLWDTNNLVTINFTHL